MQTWYTAISYKRNEWVVWCLCRSLHFPTVDMHTQEVHQPTSPTAVWPQSGALTDCAGTYGIGLIVVGPACRVCWSVWNGAWHREDVWWLFDIWLLVRCLGITMTLGIGRATLKPQILQFNGVQGDNDIYCPLALLSYCTLSPWIEEAFIGLEYGLPWHWWLNESHHILSQPQGNSLCIPG